MKYSVFVAEVIFIVTVILVGGNAEKMQCKLPPLKSVPRDWITMVDTCTQRMRDQVQEELTAAMTYLAMGAHFSQDTVNRPGFAKMFLESASEERQHAIKVMEYLVMRGGLLSDLKELIRNPVPLKTSWSTGVEALQDALNLETKVTNKILAIIKECEAPTGPVQTNDYHLVDYLTADFLEEQYQGQKDLANKISTLSKMMKSHGTLGEFLFDKKILNGELL